MTRRRLAALAALLASTAAARAQQAPVSLFRFVSPRDEVFIGFTAAALAAMGPGPEVERVARKLVADGQITAWQYTVSRAPDGSTRFATARKIAVMRNDTLRIEPYAPALPVSPPPAE